MERKNTIVAITLEERNKLETLTGTYNEYDASVRIWENYGKKRLYIQIGREGNYFDLLDETDLEAKYKSHIAPKIETFLRKLLGESEPQSEGDEEITEGSEGNKKTSRPVSYEERKGENIANTKKITKETTNKIMQYMMLCDPQMDEKTARHIAMSIIDKGKYAGAYITDKMRKEVDEKRIKVTGYFSNDDKWAVDALSRANAAISWGRDPGQFTRKQHDQVVGLLKYIESKISLEKARNK